MSDLGTPALLAIFLAAESPRPGCAVSELVGRCLLGGGERRRWKLGHPVGGEQLEVVG